MSSLRYRSVTRLALADLITSCYEVGTRYLSLRTQLREILQTYVSEFLGLQLLDTTDPLTSVEEQCELRRYTGGRRVLLRYPLVGYPRLVRSGVRRLDLELWCCSDGTLLLHFEVPGRGEEYCVRVG